MNDALARLKCDAAALLAALRDAGAKVTGDLAHIGCPFHEDACGSLSVSQKHGSWLWRGSSGGTQRN